VRQTDRQKDGQTDRQNYDSQDLASIAVIAHYWADLQSMHGLRCYDHTARTRNISECLNSLCDWFVLFKVI